MSLKYVHLIFISLSVIVTVMFGLWALDVSVPVAIAAFAASAVEAEYARRFLHKAKQL
jgi:hypothetical protein